MTPSGLSLDAHQVRRRFERIAPTYAQVDFFAREVDRRMQERLDYVRIDPRWVLDLGCGYGASLTGLQKRYPHASFLGADFVPQMVQLGPRVRAGWLSRLLNRSATHRGYMAADAQALPLSSGCVGLVWSNLLMHWLPDPRVAIAEMHRVLEPHGLLMFSALGPDTLKELRFSMSATGEGKGAAYLDLHDLGDMLVAQGFGDPVMDVEVITLTYDSLSNLLRELRAAGRGAARPEQRLGLRSAATWGLAEAAYEQWRQADGKLPASFEVVYGHAWKAPAKKIADGRSIIRFDRSIPKSA